MKLGNVGRLRFVAAAVVVVVAKLVFGDWGFDERVLRESFCGEGIAVGLWIIN